MLIIDSGGSSPWDQGVIGVERSAHRLLDRSRRAERRSRTIESRLRVDHDHREWTARANPVQVAKILMTMKFVPKYENERRGEDLDPPVAQVLSLIRNRGRRIGDGLCQRSVPVESGIVKGQLVFAWTARSTGFVPFPVSSGSSLTDYETSAANGSTMNLDP